MTKILVAALVVLACASSLTPAFARVDTNGPATQFANVDEPTIPANVDKPIVLANVDPNAPSE